MAGIGLLRCPLHDVAATQDDYLRVIRAYADAHPDAEWIEGDGWYMSAFPGGTPRATDLDRAVPDRPAYFDNRDGHGAWVNSAALARAGITAETPDPPHGRIERDTDGNPTGTLHEGAAELVNRSRHRRRRIASGAWSSVRPTCNGSASPPGRTPGSPSRSWTPTSRSPNVAGSRAVPSPATGGTASRAWSRSNR